MAVLVVLAVLFVAPARAQYLTLGGDDLDGCASNGVVVGLKAAGDGFLAVRAGPGIGHAKIDQLHNGDAIFVCTSAGAWMGIVYGGGRECGVSSPIVPARLYTGPCKSGWVHRNFIEVTAG
ncbi:integron [Aquamicrobium sp. NLF2-7]|uniref:integron n=1 Tax=Aquamicrobium sp. NLF2-7 TaxID=2918753 RepID=UPI001EFB2C39|nr:integron [Aquamicrobium sp. NLF2-7]MCG8274120.1 integron [Aquamicrobium sp. NLF2-7]